MKPDEEKPDSLGFIGTALLVVAAVSAVWFMAKTMHARSEGSPFGCAGAVFLTLALMAALAVGI